MQTKTRRRLFILFVVLFFLSVPVLVIVTQGYRVDLEDRRLVKTGGLDLGIINENANVYLNNEFKKQNNFIFRSVIFRNILPGSYSIRIEKENYIPWEKSTEVVAEAVSRFANVQLFPQNLSPEVVEQNVGNVFVSPDTSFAVAQVQTLEEDTNTTSSSVLFFNLENNEQSLFLNLEPTETLSDVQWSDNSRVFSVSVQSGNRNLLYTAPSDNPQVSINWSDFLTNNFPLALNLSSRAVPGNSPDVLNIIETEQDTTLTLHRVEFTTRIIHTEIASNIIDISILEDNAYYLDIDGTLQRTSMPEGDTTPLSPTAISNPTTQNAKILVREGTGDIAVLNRGDVFLLEEGRSLVRIAVNMDGVEWPSGKAERIMYWNEDEIVVYWLTESFGPPRRYAADRVTIDGFNNIQNAKWVGGAANHIAVQTDGGISITELDGRDRRNTANYNITTSELFEINQRTRKIHTKINDSFVGLGFE